MYINTYILGLTEENKDAYLVMAKVFAEVSKDFGAIEIFENIECDVPEGKQTDYRKAIQAEPGEKIVMSWVIWPNREIADIAHKGMFEDPRITTLSDMPFDGKRMIMGGFEPMLSYRKTD